MNKLEVYIKMFELVLPYVRSIQSQSSRVKSRDVSCYLETELIHSLPKSFMDTSITEHDIWFLNYQAKYYFEKCNDDISPNYNQHVDYIRMLFKMVSEKLKSKLMWAGP